MVYVPHMKFSRRGQELLMVIKPDPLLEKKKKKEEGSGELDIQAVSQCY